MGSGGWRRGASDGPCFATQLTPAIECTTASLSTADLPGWVKRKSTVIPSRSLPMCDPVSATVAIATTAAGALSANSQAEAAGDAANAQVQASQDATALQRDIYTDQRSLL